MQNQQITLATQDADVGANEELHALPPKQPRSQPVGAVATDGMASVAAVIHTGGCGKWHRTAAVNASGGCGRWHRRPRHAAAATTSGASANGGCGQCGCQRQLNDAIAT